MKLGDIIKVEDASTCIVKIPPDAEKESIGKYIKINRDGILIIGIIKNINNSIREDLIPYIDPELAPKYVPFNSDFRNSYYIIQALGSISNDCVKYEIDSPPDVGDSVEILERDDFRKFHFINGKPSIAYFHANSSMLPKNVLAAMITQIEMYCPESRAMLNLVRKYIMRDL